MIRRTFPSALLLALCFALALWLATQEDSPLTRLALGLSVAVSYAALITLLTRAFGPEVSP